MTITPTDVHNVQFSRPRIGKRGYSEEEVDALLDLVEQQLIAHIEDNNYLVAKLDEISACNEELKRRLSSGSEPHNGTVPRDENLRSAENALNLRQEELRQQSQNLNRRGDDLARRGEELAHRGEELARREEELAHRGEELAHRAEELARREEELARRGEELAHREEAMSRHEESLAQREAALQAHQAVLERFGQSADQQDRRAAVDGYPNSHDAQRSQQRTRFTSSISAAQAVTHDEISETVRIRSVTSVVGEEGLRARHAGSIALGQAVVSESCRNCQIAEGQMRELRRNNEALMAAAVLFAARLAV